MKEHQGNKRSSELNAMLNNSVQATALWLD